MKHFIFTTPFFLFALTACQTDYTLKPQVAEPKDTQGATSFATTQAGVRYESKLTSFGSRYFLFNSIRNDSESEISVSPPAIKVQTSCDKDALLKGAAIYKGRNADTAHAKFYDVKSETFNNAVTIAPQEEVTINYTFQVPVGRCGIISSEFSGVATAEGQGPVFKRQFEKDDSVF